MIAVSSLHAHSTSSSPPGPSSTLTHRSHTPPPHALPRSPASKPPTSSALRRGPHALEAVPSSQMISSDSDPPSVSISPWIFGAVRGCLPTSPYHPVHSRMHCYPPQHPQTGFSWEAEASSRETKTTSSLEGSRRCICGCTGSRFGTAPGTMDSSGSIFVSRQ